MPDKLHGYLLNYEAIRISRNCAYTYIYIYMSLKCIKYICDSYAGAPPLRLDGEAGARLRAPAASWHQLFSETLRLETVAVLDALQPGHVFGRVQVPEQRISGPQNSHTIGPLSPKYNMHGPLELAVHADLLTIWNFPRSQATETTTIKCPWLNSCE